MIKGSLKEYAALGSFDAALDLLPESQWKRVDEHGRTFLHYACLNNNYNAVKRLIDAGADVNAVDHGGVAPIDHAQWAHANQVMQLLIDKGSRAPKKTARVGFLVRISHAV